MKTAISIDDELLQEADEAARSMGMSRSRFFSMAVDDFMKRQRQEEMLRRLNKVYAEADPSEKQLLKGFKNKFQTVRDPW